MTNKGWYAIKPNKPTNQILLILKSKRSFLQYMNNTNLFLNFEIFYRCSKMFIVK